MHNMIILFLNVDKDMLCLALFSLKAVGMLLLISVGGNSASHMQKLFHYWLHSTLFFFDCVFKP